MSYLLSRSDPPPPPAAGPDFGALFILIPVAYSICLLGFLLSLVAHFRREQPDWIRQIALFGYGAVVLSGIYGLIILRLNAVSR